MIQFDISSIPRTLEQAKPRSLELLVKKVKISILEQVEKSGKEVDTNLQKWLKRCLLLSHFLLEEKEDFEIVLKEVREEEVKVIEKEQLYFDLLLLQSELSMPVTQEGLNKLEYDQLVGAYGKWQLLLPNLLKIKYEAQIANLEKSNWLITPTKYLILLELLIDRIYRFPVKTIFLKAIELKINQVNKDLHRFWEERSFDWSSVNRQLIPVKVVVWDTGVDSSCIKYCSSNLSLSYDKNCKLTEEPLMSIDTVTENEWELFKGFLDFKFAKRSIAANYFFKELAQYDEKDMARFKTIANQLIVYCHGTSVASVVSQGNPCIEIIPIRVTFDANHVSSTLTLYTEAWIKNSLKMHNAVFNWLRNKKLSQYLICSWSR